ncbi:ankyrin [Clavulina sp. PMI_390]|nr:ankyrin [Clavulina sp. PMI_390]
MSPPPSATGEDEGTLETMWTTAIRDFERDSTMSLTDPTLSEIFGRGVTSDAIEKALDKCGAGLEKFRDRGKFIIGALMPLCNMLTAIVDPVGDIVENAIQGISKRYDGLAKALIQIRGMLARVRTLCDVNAMGYNLRKLCMQALSQVLEIISFFVRYCAVARSKQAIKPLAVRFGDFFTNLRGDDGAQAAFAELGRLIDESDKAINAQALAVNTQKLQLIFDKILPSNVAQNQDERLEQGKVVPNHAQWLFNSVSFKDWLQSSNGFFWVSADDEAGVGKSVLWVPDKRLYDKLLASIIAHFSEASPDCEKLLLSTFPRAEIPTGVSRNKLEALVKSMLTTSGPKFLIIDALDECKDEDNHRKLLLSYLQDLTRNLPPRGGGLCIFATSRPLLDIERSLWNANHRVVTYRLRLGEQADHQATLRAFITARLNGEDFRGSNWSSSFKNGVASTLSEKSQSMFLWAQLQLDRLRSCTPADAAGMLLDLPTDLTATYSRILHEVDKQCRQTVRAVLECIIAANIQGKPLTLTEIREILRFDLKPVKNKPALLAVAGDYCRDGAQSGLPECNFDIFNYLPSALLKLEAENGRIYFIHFTVQEYLFSQPESGDDLRHYFGTSLQNARSTYFLVLLSALDTHNAPYVPTLNHKANKSWHRHATLAVADDIPIKEPLEHFLNPKSQSFAHWVEKRYKNFNFAAYRENDAPPLHHDHPVHWAVRIGSLAQVKRLCKLELENKREFSSDIRNAYDSLDRTPLCWAAVYGHVEIFNFLLEGNTSWVDQHVSMIYQDYGIWTEKFTVLNLLLCDWSCEWLNVRRRHQSKEPLEILGNHYKRSELSPNSATMLKALLDSVPSSTALELLSAQDSYCLTPLLRAFWSPVYSKSMEDRLLDVIKVLISKGTDPCHQDMDGQSIVHMAFSEGKGRIILALIAEAKIDVNLCDICGDTPLHVAMKLGCSIETVRGLLDVGADPNKCNAEGEGPLDIIPLNLSKTKEYHLNCWAEQRTRDSISLLISRGARLHSPAAIEFSIQKGLNLPC